jgi:GTPase SAR1 family protein
LYCPFSQITNPFDLSFLDNAAKLSSPSYIPTDLDILLTRSRTLKVSETDFTIKSKIFRVIDVAGQRSARPAWAIFFDDARAILFVVSLASYDQFMEEDSNANKMEDALNLFEMTCNNPILTNVAMILLLNKTDLMDAKIKTSSIRKYFPDLDGKQERSNNIPSHLSLISLLTPASKNEQELKVAKNFFKAKFEALNKTPKKYVYTHFTNSTDTTLMEVIIDACV